MPTSGVGNIPNAPRFADYPGGNLRLQSNSPCINAGLNAYGPVERTWMAIRASRVARWTSAPMNSKARAWANSYAWLAQYGLPTDGSADATDLDGDGLNNWQEYLADTSPLDAKDYLHITSFTRDGTYNTLWWTSKPTRLYQVQRRETLDAASPWETIITTAPGWNNVGFDNTGPQYFYRIQAVQP